MQQNQNLLVPISIVIAGALIGLGLFFTGRVGTPVSNTPPTKNAQTQKNVPEVTEADHIRGNINAPIIVVEYIDLECPFCKQFHETMKQVVDSYDGKVAWVMRNFPLQQLHPNAPKMSLGAECVASIAGNDAYWNFIDSIFKQAPINTLFDIDALTSTAVGVGADKAKFDACVNSDTFQKRVETEYNDAIAAGGQGTPYSIIINTKTGAQIPISGSLPIATIKAAIDAAMK
ncbi:disulfide bond formation protein DsbA [Patescibacteria group bacterium]|nr:MAG: disulfide bond formation protein DsbA [Patescibacteria group bacterium]